MENGSFQHLNLAHLNFDELNGEIAHPDQDPADEMVMAPLKKSHQKHSHQVLEFQEVPQDLRKSSTVETLISQNEDLMARLKVTLRRMTQLEDQNKAFSSELENVKQSYTSVSDQMLIWKEKERLWKERNEKLETEIQGFKARFPDYMRMEVQIERLQRYQEKVKTTIKPYVQQLKDYGQSLHVQIQGLNRQLELKETEISEAKHKATGLKEQLNEQARFYEMSQNDLIGQFEKSKESMLSDIRALSESNVALEQKAQNLDRALERQDELENLVIALRRNKEDFQSEVQAELQQLREQNRDLKQTLVEKEMAHQDLQQERENLRTETRLLLSRREELEEQLTSLRYMWTSKCEENEKLKISQASLEKLNLELSTKLNDLRKGPTA